MISVISASSRPRQRGHSGFGAVAAPVQGGQELHGDRRRQGQRGRQDRRQAEGAQEDRKHVDPQPVEAEERAPCALPRDTTTTAWCDPCVTTGTTDTPARRARRTNPLCPARSTTTAISHR